MKKIVTLLTGALIITACSTPKYAYYFDKYDYNSGRKPSTEISQHIESKTPLALTPESLTASAEVNAAPTPVAQPVASQQLSEKIASMTKAERKQLKKDLKTYAKESKKADSGNSVHATKAWDHDLKMATIFGIAAVVLTSFYFASPVFYILGIAALVVAIVFFIKWVSRQ